MADISAKTCMFSLLGPQADAVLRTLQADAVCGAPHATHTLLKFQGAAGWLQAWLGGRTHA